MTLPKEKTKEIEDLGSELAMSIDKKTKITLRLAIGIVLFVVSVTISAVTVRFVDKEEARIAREASKSEIISALEDLKQEIEETNRNNREQILLLKEKQSSEIGLINQRLSDLERRMRRQWTGSMMELWWSRSLQAGEIVDPGPIFERHSEN